MFSSASWHRSGSNEKPYAHLCGRVSTRTEVPPARVNVLRSGLSTSGTRTGDAGRKRVARPAGRSVGVRRRHGVRGTTTRRRCERERRAHGELEGAWRGGTAGRENGGGGGGVRRNGKTIIYKIRITRIDKADRVKNQSRMRPREVARKTRQSVCTAITTENNSSGSRLVRLGRII